MKKIINSAYLIILMVLLLGSMACQDSSKRKPDGNEEDSLENVEPVNLLAIGKVLPASGWKQITAEESGIVENIFVKEGDTLMPGTRILQIRSTMSELDLAQENVKLQELKELHLQNKNDLIREQLLLDQLYKKYITSKSLFDKQAETKEVMENDYSSWKQQEARVNSLKKLNSSQVKAEEEQKINIAKSRQQVENLQVSVSEGGVLTELLVKTGQYITNTDLIGTYGDLNELVIEAELDELYSDRVKIGQSVVCRKLGQSAEIAHGEVIYVSPTLSDKSIIYESANEAQDRRVRKLKISVKNSSSILINSKVECLINLN